MDNTRASSLCIRRTIRRRSDFRYHRYCFRIPERCHPQPGFGHRESAFHPRHPSTRGCWPSCLNHDGPLPVTRIVNNLYLMDNTRASALCIRQTIRRRSDFRYHRYCFRIPERCHPQPGFEHRESAFHPRHPSTRGCWPSCLNHDGPPPVTRIVNNLYMMENNRASSLCIRRRIRRRSDFRYHRYCFRIPERCHPQPGFEHRESAFHPRHPSTRGCWPSCLNHDGPLPVTRIVNNLYLMDNTRASALCIRQTIRRRSDFRYHRYCFRIPERCHPQPGFEHRESAFHPRHPSTRGCWPSCLNHDGPPPVTRIVNNLYMMENNRASSLCIRRTIRRRSDFRYHRYCFRIPERCHPQPGFEHRESAFHPRHPSTRGCWPSCLNHDGPLPVTRIVNNLYLMDNTRASSLCIRRTIRRRSDFRYHRYCFRIPERCHPQPGFEHRESAFHPRHPSTRGCWPSCLNHDGPSPVTRIVNNLYLMENNRASFLCIRRRIRRRSDFRYHRCCFRIPERCHPQPGFEHRESAFHPRHPSTRGCWPSCLNHDGPSPVTRIVNNLYLMENNRASSLCIRRRIRRRSDFRYHRCCFRIPERCHPQPGFEHRESAFHPRHPSTRGCWPSCLNHDGPSPVTRIVNNLYLMENNRASSLCIRRRIRRRSDFRYHRCCFRIPERCHPQPGFEHRESAFHPRHPSTRGCWPSCLNHDGPLPVTRIVNNLYLMDNTRASALCIRRTIRRRSDFRYHRYCFRIPERCHPQPGFEHRESAFHPRHPSTRGCWPSCLNHDGPSPVTRIVNNLYMMDNTRASSLCIRRRIRRRSDFRYHRYCFRIPERCHPQPGFEHRESAFHPRHPSTRGCWPSCLNHDGPSPVTRIVNNLYLMDNTRASSFSSTTPVYPWLLAILSQPRWSSTCNQDCQQPLSDGQHPGVLLVYSTDDTSTI